MDPMTVRQRLDHAVDEFAQRIVATVIETKDDLPFDDQTTIYRICEETVLSMNLPLAILNRLKQLVLREGG